MYEMDKQNNKLEKRGEEMLSILLIDWFVGFPF